MKQHSLTHKELTDAQKQKIDDFTDPPRSTPSSPPYTTSTPLSPPSSPSHTTISTPSVDDTEKNLDDPQQKDGLTAPDSGITVIPERPPGMFYTVLNLLRCKGFPSIVRGV